MITQSLPYTPHFFPGWGFSPEIGETLFKKGAPASSKSPHILIGWSFGGLQAIRLAHEEKANYKGLVLLNATPKFAAEEDWPGITRNAQTYFLKRLTSDLARFKTYYLSLVQGADDQERYLLPLQEQQHLLPKLFEADLRDLFERIEMPILSLMGAQDRILTPEVNQKLPLLNDNTKTLTLPRAGHGMMMTHPRFIKHAIDVFVREKC